MRKLIYALQAPDYEEQIKYFASNTLPDADAVVASLQAEQNKKHFNQFLKQKHPQGEETVEELIEQGTSNQDFFLFLALKEYMQEGHVGKLNGL